MMRVALAPAQGVFGQLGLDLRKGAALKVAKTAFTQIGLGREGCTRGVRHGLGRGPGALQIAGVDGGHGLVGEGPRQLPRLPQAGVVERDVEMPLDAGVHVPGGFSVADGDDARSLHGRKCSQIESVEVRLRILQQIARARLSVCQEQVKKSRLCLR